MVCACKAATVKSPHFGSVQRAGRRKTVPAFQTTITVEFQTICPGRTLAHRACVHLLWASTRSSHAAEEKMLQDGKYLTVPIHGNPSATRWIDVDGGSVKLNGWSFTQEDFFKVNRLA